MRYDDLLADWTRTVGRVGEALDLAAVRDAPASAIREVHCVRRPAPEPLAARVGRDADPGRAARAGRRGGELVSRAGRRAGAAADDVTERLDAARAAYLELYGEAEAVAHSSIAAATRTRASATPRSGRIPEPALWLINSVPERHRRRIPARWRAGAARVLRRGPRPGAAASA